MKKILNINGFALELVKDKNGEWHCPSQPSISRQKIKSYLLWGPDLVTDHPETQQQEGDEEK